VTNDDTLAGSGYDDGHRNVPHAPAGHRSFVMLRHAPYRPFNGIIRCECSAEHALVDHSAHLGASSAPTPPPIPGPANLRIVAGTGGVGASCSAEG
jgi:hypothetical protein